MINSSINNVDSSTVAGWGYLDSISIGNMIDSAIISSGLSGNISFGDYIDLNISYGPLINSKYTSDTVYVSNDCFLILKNSSASYNDPQRSTIIYNYNNNTEIYQIDVYSQTGKILFFLLKKDLFSTNS